MATGFNQACQQALVVGESVQQREDVNSQVRSAYLQCNKICTRNMQNETNLSQRFGQTRFEILSKQLEKGAVFRLPNYAKK